VARCLVFADDATGALEAGALLAGAGLRTVVSLDWRACAEGDVDASVILLPTRHLNAAAARSATLAALPAHLGADPPLIYWKTDSTLRGPIGACFQALLDTLPERLIVYAPAYPAVGRTAKQGVLRVHGRPVAETEFADDSLNPVHSSSAPEIVSKGCSTPILLASGATALQTILETQAHCVAVCDSETEEELEAIFADCEGYARCLVLAGPAGGIRYWARWFGVITSDRKPLPQADRWLVVCGSRHPVSRAQAQAATLLGLKVLESTWEDSSHGDSEAERLAVAAAKAEVRAMMIFGGDTALAVWRKLGVESLTPWGEVLPGVAVSLSGPWVFITKAGGYGAPDLVERVLERWRT